MLDQIDLSRKMDKKEFKKMMSKLQPELAALQRRCKELGIPVIIVFEGFGASGKGVQISQLIQALDPRGFTVYATGSPTEEEKMRPFLWRFWVKTPEKGRIAIFDRSWYRKVQLDRFDEKTSDQELSYAYSEINSFEEQLVTGGNALIKLFLCIDKKDQKRRFEKLLSRDSSEWRVSKGDLKRNKHYEDYKQINDEMLEKTDTDVAPWTIIESVDKEFAAVKIYMTVIRALKDKIAAVEAVKTLSGENGAKKDPEKSSYEKEDGEEIIKTSSLHSVDLSKSLTKEEYNRELVYLQKKLSRLHGELYKRRIPLILGFEGWDAGGKGGAIKRLTQALDPRGYQVNPTASPNDLERSHHYLWRFWTKVPKNGHVAIFDRTWYGRVMVERIEGFCSEEEWKRAYKEINDMEYSWVNDGAIVIKFWLQIDKDEQERRFNDRMNNPEKQWKITDEDWRNRAKWDQYEEAVDEMLVRTSTTYAPWVIVEGNDKLYARIKVLKTVVDALEKRLGR